jgi:putative transposase
MSRERGVVFTHEAVHEWDTKLCPVLSEALRKQRHGKVGRSRYCAKTYLPVGHKLFRVR